ncbi:STAS/SEC14 domain-containing protein [Salinimicrobium soli]|uniref:STAS/SEC14 domain-containing protein n=1 Tax=Salinimicrobium soli TaxID=1254399 RepID=UPI003AAB9323
MKTTFEFSDDVFGVVLDEKLNTEKLKRIHEMLRERLQKCPKVSVYVEDQKNDGISLKAFLKDLAFELGNDDGMRKIAIVTDLKWFQLVTDLKNKLVETNIKSFDSQERMKAMNWVME